MIRSFQMKMYVGNMSYDVSEENLRVLFEPFGAIESVKLVLDKFTGKSKGFAFIEMLNDEEAKKAIEGLDGKELKGRSIKVNEANPMTENRSPRGFGGGAGGNRGGFGSNDRNQGKGGFNRDRGGYSGSRGGRGGDR
jgi:cold-inducible RNA-binding protein